MVWQYADEARPYMMMIAGSQMILAYLVAVIPLVPAALCIVELATAGPGFAVDETVERLGTSLQLPRWLEQHRTQISASLTPIRLPVSAG